MRIKPFPREGAWAVDEQGQVGLTYMGEYPDGRVQEEFHVCDSSGNTTLSVVRSWAGLRQAKLNEIPAARIAGVPQEQLVAMGYSNS